MAIACESRLSSEQSQRIRDRLAQAPSAMTLQLAADLGVPEVEIIRHMPPERAVELDGRRWQEIFEELPHFGSVHVIVSNGAATLEAEGEFGGFSTWGEFFNVQTKSLDMHVRFRELGAVFAVEKPSHMESAEASGAGPLAGRKTTVSFQFFDRAGHSAFKVFLNFGGKPSEQRRRQFADLRARFALSPATQQEPDA